MRRTAEKMIGERYGRLVVEGIERTRGKSGRTYAVAVCRCDCGAAKGIRVENIKAKHGSRSCGCAQREQLRGRNYKHGESKWRGGVTKEYRTWAMMLSRCRNPNCAFFKNYGGRGIKVCEKWHQYLGFLEDMGRAPAPYYTLERKDVNGDYCPENCCWIPKRLQGKNTRRCRRLTYNGETLILTDWGMRFGIGISAVKRILNKYGEQDGLRLLHEKGPDGL